MANYEKVRSLTRTPVTGVVRANRFVEVTSAGAIQEVGSVGGDSVGVLLEASGDGSTSSVSIGLLDGARIPVEAGAAITLGARVMADAQGRVITAVGANARVLGYADEAASAAGELITVLTSRASGTFVS